MSVFFTFCFIRLSQELLLKEEKETLLFEDINKLKTEIKDKNQREFAL